MMGVSKCVSLIPSFPITYHSIPSHTHSRPTGHCLDRKNVDHKERRPSSFLAFMLWRLVFLLCYCLALLPSAATMASAAAVATQREEDAAGGNPLARVVVLGARGKTGSLVVEHLKGAGAGKVLAVARNTSGMTTEGDGVVEWVQGDVRDAKRMAELFEGASAVVFAASASQGWTLRGDNTPKHVDYEAVVRLAFGVVALAQDWTWVG